MNEELKNIFGDAIKVGNKPIPTAHIKYKGKETTFVVWTITGNTPALSGDDEQLYGTITVDVDIYSKGNYLSVLKEVKRLMKENEWIWTEDSPEMYEDDTELYHITASFEKERIL
jgi:hypothetical protein